ncbi:MAG: universal stress protein [Nitratireductor sp.]
MTKLVALIDGSDYSKSVCEYAAWIAKGVNGSVEIIHSLSRRDMPQETSDISGSIGLGARSALLEELAEIDQQKAQLIQKRGRALLDDAVQLIESKGIQNVEAKLRKDGLIDTLHDFEQDAALILIGKRGQSANYAASHLGSNMERVVRESKKPVFVASRAFKPIEKILLAFDGGKSALYAVEHLSKSTVFGGKTIHLLTVGSESEENKAALEKASASLKTAGYTVSTEIVAGAPAEVISEKAKSDNYDMLVRGAYGHSRIRSLIIGSTTTQLIRMCKIPVLMFR